MVYSMFLNVAKSTVFGLKMQRKPGTKLNK